MKSIATVANAVAMLFVLVLSVAAARPQDAPTERRRAFLPTGFDYANPLGSRNDNETRFSNTRSVYKSVEPKAFLVTNAAELAEVVKLIPGSDFSKKVNVAKEAKDSQDRVLFIFGGEREVPYKMEVKQVH